MALVTAPDTHAAFELADLARVTPERALELAFLAMRTLSELGAWDEVDDIKAESLERFAHDALTRAGIDAETSRLGFLHDEVAAAAALRLSGLGRHAEACWLLHAPRSPAIDDSEAGKHRFHAADALLSLRAGHVKRAIAAAELAEQTAADQEQAARFRLQRSTGLMLAGRLPEARALLGLFERSPPPDSVKAALRWREVALSVTHRDDISSLTAAASRKGAHLDAADKLTAFLWTHAAQRREWRTRLPALEGLARGWSPELKANPAFARLFKAVSSVAKLYSSSSSVELKRASARDLIATAPRLATIEQELLLLAAVARWIITSRQGVLADVVVEAYRARSLALSDGAQADAFGLIEDFTGRTLLTLLDLPAKQVGGQAPAPGVIEYGKAAGAIARLAISGIARVSLTRFREGDTAGTFKSDLVRALLEGSAKRRGVILKVGQLLGSLEGVLADDVKDAFREASIEIEPMPLAQCEDILSAELKRPVGECLRELDPQPFALGSMGQVHRAVTLDGRAVAVKIRYAGLDQVLELDLKRASLIRPIAAKRFPNLAFDDVLAEIILAIRAELDFRKELDNLYAMREVLAEVPGVRVPAPVPELCTQQVFTTELVTGKRYGDFLQESTQEQRNRAGMRLLEAALTSIHVHGVFHADPSPANLLFTDDALWFLDFGSVKRLDPAFRLANVELLRAYFRNDPVGVHRQFTALGFLDRPEAASPEQVMAFYDRCERQYTSPQPFKYDLAVATAFRETIGRANPLQSVVSLPADHVLLSRSDLWLNQIFADLEVEGNFRDVFLRILGLDARELPKTSTK